MEMLNLNSSNSKNCLYQYVCNNLEWTYVDVGLV